MEPQEAVDHLGTEWGRSYGTPGGRGAEILDKVLEYAQSGGNRIADVCLSCMAYFHLASQNKYHRGMQNGDCNMAADGSCVKSKGYFFKRRSVRVILEHFCVWLLYTTNFILP